MRSLICSLMIALSCSSFPSSVLFGQDDVRQDTIVEQMPEFPGGQAALFRFLGRNIKYPQKALKKNISGTVYVTFVIRRDGSISDAKVLKGIGGGCDQEAIRVVELMPKWKPGMQRGKTVSVQYNLPIKFTIRQDEKKKGSK